MSEWLSGDVRNGSGGGSLDFLSCLTYKPRPLSERNLTYAILGEAIVHLANMGASDEQLRGIARKGARLTFKDIAEVYCSNLRDGDYRC